MSAPRYTFHERVHGPYREAHMRTRPRRIHPGWLLAVRTGHPTAQHPPKPRPLAPRMTRKARRLRARNTWRYAAWRH